jgi:hypothetical protein
VVKVGEGTPRTVISRLLLAAGLPVAHGVALELTITATTSLFKRPLVVNVELLVPAFTPLTFHWKLGELPPFKAVAVKVTDVPEQMVVALVAIETLTGNAGLTIIGMLLLVAGLPVAQGVALEVRTTVTTSLLDKVPVVNVLLLVPALIPFTFHW